MNPFTFACPGCGQHITAEPQDAGKRVACPHCHIELTIPPAPGGPPAAQKTSGLAIASLVCSLFLCLGAIPGIICGHLAKRRIKRDPSLKGMGLANAGLIISYVCLALTCWSVGSWAYRLVSGTRQAIRQTQQHFASKGGTNSRWVALRTNITSADQQLAATGGTNAAPQEAATPGESNQPGEESSPNPPPAATMAEHPEQAPSPTTWTLNLDSVHFPEHPVSGSFRGAAFAAASERYRNGSLTIADASGAAYVIGLGLKRGEPLGGTSYTVTPADSASKRRVSLAWQEDGNPTTQRVPRGYAMKLEFGESTRNRIQGRIYLCLPGTNKNCAAGTFTLPGK